MQEPREGSGSYIRVRVEPSPRVTPGIYIDVNNHFDIKDDALQMMLNILKESWKDVLANSRKIADYLVRENK
jgi:hypothetical protein